MFRNHDCWLLIMMIIIIIKIMNTPLWTIDIVFTVYGFQHRVKPQLQVYRWWWATKGIQWMANPSITSSRSRRVVDRVLCKSTSTSQLKGLDKVVRQCNGRLEQLQHQMKAQRGLWCESTKAFRLVMLCYICAFSSNRPGIEFGRKNFLFHSFVWCAINAINTHPKTLYPL